jgi:acetoacetate decarboxylase
MLFYIGKLNIDNYAFKYSEAALVVPILDQSGNQGWYPIVLYLDHPNPIIGGREIYGYPKKEAEKISFEEKDGTITAGVTRYGV